MKWLYYSALGMGVGAILAISISKMWENKDDIAYKYRKLIDDVYYRIEDAYESLKNIKAEDVKNDLARRLDDVRQRFTEFDFYDVKENVKQNLDNFTYEVKNIVNQIQSHLSAQWLKFRDQTA